MSEWEFILWALVAGAGVIGSAWCSGFEIGMYSLNRVRLNLRVARGERPAERLKREIDRPNRSLATLLIANTIYGSISATGISQILDSQGFSHGQLIILNLTILTPLLLVFGEAVPKELFRVRADRLTYATSPVLLWTRRLFTLLLVLPLVEQFAALATRLVKSSAQADLSSPRHTVAALLKEGATHGLLSETQTGMLDRALLLRETLVRGEMVPWPRVRTISVASDRRQIALSLQQAPFSSYPVVDSAGAVLGVVSHLDLCLSRGRAPAELMKPAVRLDPSMSVREGLLALRRSGAMLGVVMHDGKPVGIVTPTDLIEPLISPAAHPHP